MGEEITIWLGDHFKRSVPGSITIECCKNISPCIAVFCEENKNTFAPSVIYVVFLPQWGNEDRYHLIHLILHLQYYGCCWSVDSKSLVCVCVGGGGGGGGGGLKTHELLNLRALKILMLYKNHIFQLYG